MKDYLIIFLFLCVYPVLKMLIGLKHAVMIVALKHEFTFIDRLTYRLK